MFAIVMFFVLIAVYAAMFCVVKFAELKRGGSLANVVRVRRGVAFGPEISATFAFADFDRRRCLSLYCT